MIFKYLPYPMGGGRKSIKMLITDMFLDTVPLNIFLRRYPSEYNF